MPHSEDYYGDLDLKTIRKSELLQGLQGNGQSRANSPSQPAPAPKAASKPRPAAPARPAPQSRPATAQPGQGFDDSE